MKFALMGKVLCASCKIERRSNVIQHLFKRSCIIAKAFLSPQEKRTARVFWGNICIYFKEIFHNQLRGWNECQFFHQTSSCRLYKFFYFMATGCEIHQAKYNKKG